MSNISQRIKVITTALLCMAFIMHIGILIYNKLNPALPEVDTKLTFLLLFKFALLKTTMIQQSIMILDIMICLNSLMAIVNLRNQ